MAIIETDLVPPELRQRLMATDAKALGLQVLRAENEHTYAHELAAEKIHNLGRFALGLRPTFYANFVNSIELHRAIHGAFKELAGLELDDIGEERVAVSTIFDNVQLNVWATVYDSVPIDTHYQGVRQG